MKEGAQSQLVCPWAILAAVCIWIIEIRGMCWYARSQLPIQTQKTTRAPTGPPSPNLLGYLGPAPLSVERKSTVEEAQAAESETGFSRAMEMEFLFHRGHQGAQLARTFH